MLADAGRYWPAQQAGLLPSLSSPEDPDMKAKGRGKARKDRRSEETGNQMETKKWGRTEGRETPRDRERGKRRQNWDVRSRNRM